MTEFIKINGQAVRLTRFYRRTVQDGDEEPAIDEIELVIMLRGRTVQRSFQELLHAPRFLIEIPDDDSMEMALASASLQSSGTGEGAVHRYDVTFRELPESAIGRSHQRRDEAETPANTTPLSDPANNDEEEIEADDGRGVDLGEESTVAWAAALRQQTESQSAASAAPPDEPLTPAELAGVESVLVGLRLEALIGELEQAGVLQRGAVEAAFLNLVSERFEAEAIPIIGESAAHRAARSALGS